MNEELKTFIDRMVDTAADLENLENVGAIHKNFTLGNSVLKIALQLVYEQIVDLRKIYNEGRSLESAKINIWIRQRRIFNKITAIAEIVPLSFYGVHDTLSRCSLRILACGGGYKTIDNRLFEFNEIAPSKTKIKRDDFTDERFFEEADEITKQIGF